MADRVRKALHMLPITESTRERLEALFAPEDRAEAERLLAEECSGNLPFCEDATPESAERIRYAVLKLSRGSLDELRRAIAEAQMDWRDVLMAAGFGCEVEAHLRWHPRNGPDSA